MRKHFFLLLLIMISFYAQEENEEDKVKDVIDLKGIKVYMSEKKIETFGVVNMNKGLVELLATAPGGKEHESVLKVYCNPALLHTALLLIGLEKGGGGEKQGDADPIYGGEIYIYVSWEQEKEKKVVRAEKLIKNAKINNSMEECKWIFTGSRFVKNQKDSQRVYMANITGVLIATFYDPDAVLNNPLPERADDTTYYANEDILPEKGTDVKITFSTTPL